MISLGSAAWTSERPNITLSFAYEKRRSGADMQYRAQMTVSAVSGYSYFGYPIYMGLSIGGTYREGQTLKNAYPEQWTSAITYTSPWYTVSNKTTGTTPVSFHVYSGLGSSRTATYTYNMEVDPAASEISAPSGTLGTSLTLSLTRYNTSFTDTITYKCGTAKGTVKSGSTAATVAWDATNGNTVALAAQNTSGQSVVVTFTVTTYSEGTVVGTNTTKATLAIPKTVKPSVALNVWDATGYYSTYGAYVQGYSKLRISTTSTLAYGSPITTYAITADGNSYALGEVTTEALKGKGTLTVTAKVTDARTRPSEVASQNITVLEYAKPVVNLSAYRCNSSGSKDPEGAYMKIVVTSTISSLNSKNSATYKVVYPGGTLTGSGTSVTSSVLDCDVSLTHNIEVTVTDKLSSTTKATVVPIAYTLLDYYHTGKGIAFGKVATRDGFDCAMPAYFTGGIQAIMLTSADNLVNVKNNGWYRWTLEDPPAGIPTSSGTARMTALRVWTTSSAVCCQEIMDMTNSVNNGCLIRRTIYNDTVYPWEWVNPPMALGVEYRTTERFATSPVYKKALVLGNVVAGSTLTIAHNIPNIAYPIECKLYDSVGTIIGAATFVRFTTSTITVTLPVGVSGLGGYTIYGMLSYTASR